MERHTKRILTWAGWVLAAGLGGTCGLLITAQPARACTCSQASWLVKLRSVTSDDPTVNHASIWPAEGELTSYPGVAHVWVLEQEPGKVHRFGVGR